MAIALRRLCLAGWILVTFGLLVVLLGLAGMEQFLVVATLSYAWCPPPCGGVFDPLNLKRSPQSSFLFYSQYSRGITQCHSAWYIITNAVSNQSIMDHVPVVTTHPPTHGRLWVVVGPIFSTAVFLPSWCERNFVKRRTSSVVIIN